jgi:hypothetical protein
MTAIVPGIYKQGKVELLGVPAGLPEGPVRVVLIGEGEGNRPSQPLTYGKYGKGRLSTLEDFKDAEWHGEQEFDALHGQ